MRKIEAVREFLCMTEHVSVVDQLRSLACHLPGKERDYQRIEDRSNIK